MRVAISGTSGLVGGELVRRLEQRGDQVVRLVRSGGGSASAVLWDPQSGLMEKRPMEELDALVHLAGAGIADRRWSDARQRVLFESRVAATNRLVESCATLDTPPKTFLCASAIGYYGNRGDQIVDEDSSAGSGFLADLCVAWEQASETADWAQRVHQLRTGIVLSTAGGALPKMLPPFRLGLGGRLGSGQQYMSWISIDDEVGAILYLLDNEFPSGPINLVAPKPVTNQDFTQALGQALHRPTVLPMPAFAVRTLFGQMGEEALLGSQRVSPARPRSEPIRVRPYDCGHGARPDSEP